MWSVARFFTDPRRVFCYGGGFLLIGIATIPFFLSRPQTMPPIQAPPPGVLAPNQNPAPHAPPATRGYGFPVGLYVLGFLLLLAGGRSESEKRGYHF